MEETVTYNTSDVLFDILAWPKSSGDDSPTWKNISYSTPFFKNGTRNRSMDFPNPEMSTETQVALCTVYGLSVLFSVTGNTMVIAVLLFGNRSRSDLSIFLINLALSDIGMAVFCMPFTFTQSMLGRWIYGSFMCTYVLFNQLLMVSVSVYTNMAIGIDRYWAVMYPLQSRLTKTRAKISVGVIWLVSLAMASVQLVVGRLGVNNDCNEQWPDPMETYKFGYTIFVLFSTYVLPLTILAFTYYRLGRALWERTTPGNADEARDQLQLRSKRRVIKMLVTVVSVFAVCWLPLHLLILVIDTYPDLHQLIETKVHENIYYAVFYSCHWLAMANSFANPIIYMCFNETFRNDMRFFFNRCFPCCKCVSSATEAVSRTLSTRASLMNNTSRRSSQRSAHKETLHYRTSDKFINGNGVYHKNASRCSSRHNSAQFSISSALTSPNFATKDESYNYPQVTISSSWKPPQPGKEPEMEMERLVPSRIDENEENDLRTQRDSFDDIEFIDAS